MDPDRAREIAQAILAQPHRVRVGQHKGIAQRVDFHQGDHAQTQASLTDFFATDPAAGRALAGFDLAQRAGQITLPDRTQLTAPDLQQFLSDPTHLGHFAKQTLELASRGEITQLDQISEALAHLQAMVEYARHQALRRAPREHHPKIHEHHNQMAEAVRGVRARVAHHIRLANDPTHAKFVGLIPTPARASALDPSTRMGAVQAGLTDSAARLAAVTAQLAAQRQDKAA